MRMSEYPSVRTITTNASGSPLRKPQVVIIQDTLRTDKAQVLAEWEGTSGS